MPIRPRTSPETAAKIRALYLAGEKVDVIALDCGVSPLTVDKLTGDLPRRKPKEEAKRLRILELAGTGLDIGAIAREVGCPIATVRRALRPRPLTREEEDARLDALQAAAKARAKARKATPPAAALERPAVVPSTVHEPPLRASSITRTRLSDEQVRELRERAAAGETDEALGEAYGLSASGAAQIRRGSSRPHSGGPITLRPPGKPAQVPA